MSLHCLALLGNKNEPIYICASAPIEGTCDNDNDNDTVLSSLKQEDVFGFFEDNDASEEQEQKQVEPPAVKSGFIKRPASIRHEMMIHAAIDRIEELLGSHRKTSWKRFQRGSHWIGKICPMEEYEIYGCVTSSDVKILALLERDEIIPLKKRKEVDIKIMFTAIHDCYVKHTLNPFSKIKGKIEPPCCQFEKSLQGAMNEYNNVANGN